MLGLLLGERGDTEGLVDCEPLARVRRLLGNAALAGGDSIPGAEQLSARSVVMHALVRLLDPQRHHGGSVAAVDQLKSLICSQRVMHRLLQAVADAYVALSAAERGGYDWEPLAWRLGISLTAVEHMLFCCEPAAEIATTAPVQCGAAAAVSFPEHLLSVLGALGPRRLAAQQEAAGGKEAVLGVIRALNNLAHTRLAAAEALGRAGALRVCLSLLGELAGPPEAPADRCALPFPHLLENVDACNQLLVLMINLVDHAASNRARAIAAGVASQGGMPAAAGEFLCLLLRSAVGLSGRGEEGASEQAPGSPREVTEESLLRREREGEARSMLVYLSVLLGFLMVSEDKAASQALREHVTIAVPGNQGLVAVRQGILECLTFYSRAGAMERRDLVQLQRLLEALA